MRGTDAAIVCELLREHFPVDITDEHDTRGRRFHCSCGFTGADTKLDPALTHEDWLAHFGKILLAN